jgi:hypothetical protein
MVWRWPSQNTFGMWTMLYWTQSSRTQFGVSINVCRLAGDTLNITCNFLYCNHQVHRDFLIILYNTVRQVSADPPTLSFPPLCLVFCSLPLKSPHVAPTVSPTGQNRHCTDLLLQSSPLYFPLYTTVVPPYPADSVSVVSVICGSPRPRKKLEN